MVAHRLKFAPKLGRDRAHRMAMLRSETTSTLVEEGRAREWVRRGRGIEEAPGALLAAFGCTARLAAAASVRVAPFVRFVRFVSLFLFFDRPHLLLLCSLV